jgi:uncharacterized membrane protein HdeD (DUF308 family)
MSFLKNAKKRIIAFVVGIVATALGLLMLYYDFFGKKANYYSDTSYYSWAALLIGIASLMIAFEKKKKDPEQKMDPPEQPRDTDISSKL